LLAARGRRTEARTTLAAIYGWFTEGLDTADLREARALLTQLGSRRAARR
jgi:adenylate cyclase